MEPIAADRDRDEDSRNRLFGGLGLLSQRSDWFRYVGAMAIEDAVQNLMSEFLFMLRLYKVRPERRKKKIFPCIAH
jgi:hypothetical protein